MRSSWLLLHSSHLLRGGNLTSLYTVHCMLATVSLLLWSYFVGNSNIHVLLHILWQLFLILDKINVHRLESLQH